MGLTTKGLSWENFITDGGEGLRVGGRENFELEDLRMFDLMSSE